VTADVGIARLVATREIKKRDLNPSRSRKKEPGDAVAGLWMSTAFAVISASEGR
jgi:hypothetical protein